MLAQPCADTMALRRANMLAHLKPMSKNNVGLNIIYSQIAM